jgi:hypothetical protein
MARTWSNRYSFAGAVFKINGKTGNEIDLTAADIGAAQAGDVSSLQDRISAIEERIAAIPVPGAKAWLGNGYLGGVYLSGIVE